MKRLWHFFVSGHRWQVVGVVVNPPSDPNQRYLIGHTDYHTRYGFTETHFECGCGAHKTWSVIGKLEKASDDELKELRRMVKL